MAYSDFKDVLSERHYFELSKGSGISDKVIQAIGFFTAYTMEQVAQLGFSGDQRRVPALILPMFGPNEHYPVRYQLKADNPRTSNGKPRKYEWPYAVAPVLACPPVQDVQDALLNPRGVLFITEGLKKAAAAVSNGIPCLSLNGVWNWKAKDSRGLKTTIGELDTISWQDRAVYLCFDNDVMTKDGVYWSLIRLAAQLRRRGANVKFTLLPEGEDSKGLDDFLTHGGTLEGLFSLSSDSLPESPGRRYTYNDAGMAYRVADVYADEMIFDNHNDTWYIWANTSWVKDRPGSFVRKRVLEYTDLMRDEAGIFDINVASEKKKLVRHLQMADEYGDFGKIRGATSILQSLMAEEETAFDRQPELLNCVNGTLDLRTDEFYPHKPSDRLTVVCPTRYISDAAAPLWKQMMEERFPDVKTREFIQRMSGLFVTGKTSEKAFFILRGEKDCGKTVFVETLQKVLGQYANKVDKSTLTKGKGIGDNRQQEKAVALVGKRMVFVDESSASDRIDDAYIKELTGGDATLTFRRLYEQANKAPAEFTLMLATNFKPRITGQDDAVWRRCYLIEFGDTMPRDKQISGFGDILLEKESEGILAWMVEGYRMWRRDGLALPEEVKDWTLQYREENDPFGKFISEQYEIHSEVEGFLFPADIAVHYEAWCEEMEYEGIKLKGKSAIGKVVRQRWPIVNDGARKSGGRPLYHIRRLEEFRDGNKPKDGDQFVSK